MKHLCPFPRLPESRLPRRLLAALAGLMLVAPSSIFANRDWSAVKSWVYQLTKYKDGKLDEIANAGFDLAVIDLARDGKDAFFTREEIAAVKQQGVIVLAYFEIGAIENYRPEWKEVAEDLKVGVVKGWPKERLVRFWDERWWPVVKGRVDQALKAGFDGAYLDMVTAYEEIPAKGMKREELAHKMVALISRLSQYAKAANPQFKIVPQNSPELYNWSYWDGKPNETYIKAIDGLGIEDVFYLAHDKPATARWAKENRDNALAIKQAGKLVLGVDYAKTPACIADAYAKQRAIGFVPYVTVVQLDVVRQETETERGTAAGEKGDSAPGSSAIAASAITPVPEKVAPAIADRQDAQVPDRVHLTGWVGTRIQVNESNRLAKLDPARLLEGYRKRPGRQTWDGEHVGKWLHAATLAWANTGDPALREKLDYTAAELVKCQLPDGYLGTYEESSRWTQWDVWAHKYNLIGLVTYMRYTGNMAPLPTCRRMADLLCTTFGDEPGKRDIILAGQHMGMAPTSVLEPMVLLYRLTGEPRYLDFCKYILRAWEHPNGPHIVSTLLTEERVNKVGNGKAYEMLSCLNGALEYYRTTGDRQLFDACLNAWQDIVDHRLYLTGAASYREFFRDDFDLPNINNVGETCVTVTWLQFNAQLLRLTGEARFAEQLERVVLNQLFGAQCPDGSAWGYYVQMQGKKPYSATLDGHCCLSSGPRGISLIPTFAVTTDADGVVVNLYDEGVANLQLRDGAAVNVTTATKYPGDDRIRITLAPNVKKSFALKLRIPAWCDSPELRMNDKPVKAERGPDGYVALRQEWKKGDYVQLRLKLEPRVVVGDHKNEGRIAVLYGPLVLAADEALLGDKECPLSAVGVSDSKLAALHFTPEPAPDKLKSWSGAEVFRITGVACKTTGSVKQGTPLKVGLVPFADAGATGTAYKIWLPFEAPRANRNLLLDGIEVRSRKPNAGSIIDDNLQTIASTFNSKRAPQDWFGVELDEPVTAARIVFVHGKSFHDGGWFDAGARKPRVEIQSTPKGSWVPLCELADYPATTATDSAGLKGGERFACELPKPVELCGLRVIGKPACGDSPKQAFSSCAELQAFAPQRQ